MHADAGERDARLLGILRFIIFALWVFDISSPALSSLALLPHQLLEPVVVLWFLSPAAFEWLLQPTVLTVFQSLILIFAAMAAIGMRPYRPIAIVAATLITLEQALVRSYNYSNHAEVLLLLSTYVVALAPAADRFSWPGGRELSDRPGTYKATIAFVAVIASFTYVAAAAYRTAHHGLSMFASTSMAHSIVQNSFRHGSSAAGIYLLQHPAVAVMIQPLVPIATAFELAAPLALLFRRFRWLWLAFLTTFHVISAFVMNVAFWYSLLVAGAAMILFDRAGGADSA